MTKIRSTAPLILSLVIAAATLFPARSTIPGLHGDEAWVGLRAHDILRGARPIVGMNNYTGPVHQYLVAILFHFFGCSVGILRLVTPLVALPTIILFHRVIERLFNLSIANSSVLLLVSAPFFTGYGRLANEVFALNPFLAVTAIFLILEAAGKSLILSNILLCLSGICMGLGIWNHAIFAAFPPALLLAALVRRGITLFRGPELYSSILGLVLVLGLRISLGSAQDIALNATLHVAILRRLTEWPSLLLQLAHGDILYQRFAGQVIWKTPNLVLIILIAALVARFTNKRRDPLQLNRFGMATLVFAVALFLGTLLLCPSNSDRYFLLVLYLVPLLLAFGLAEIFQISSLRPLAPFIFAMLIFVQLGRTGVNYFYSQATTGGRPSSFFLGSQEETSNHFLRTDLLYQELASQSAKTIHAESLLAWPLEFYDLDNHCFTNVVTEDLTPTKPATRIHSADTLAVLYADRIRQIGPGQFRDFKILSQDSRFIIMVPNLPPR